MVSQRTGLHQLNALEAFKKGMLRYVGIGVHGSAAISLARSALTVALWLLKVLAADFNLDPSPEVQTTSQS